MAEVESHSNGNGKHALDDDGVDAPVKAKLLKTENGNGVAKAANGNGVKEDEAAAVAESVPVVDEEKSVGASNDSNGVSDVAAGDQSNNKSDFNESESGAVSTGGVGDESNTNDLGVTNSSTNDLRNENTNESVGDAVLVSGGRRRVKEIGDNSADNYEDDEDDEDDDDVGPDGEDEEEGGEDEDDDEVEDDEDEEGGDGEDDEDDGEDGGEE